MEPEVLFRETVYDGKHLDHGCDDEVILLKYPLDRPFGTMRRDLHFERKKDYEATTQQRIQWYIEDKQRVSEHNHALREYLRHHRDVKFYTLLETFDVIRFIQTKKPTPFTIPIYDARFLYNDGNEKSILATDNRDFYLLKWSGS